MRKLIVQTFVTLDGVMQAPGGPGEDDDGGFAYGGWSVNYWDEPMGQVMGEATSRPFAMVLGRRTYDITAAYWPDAPEEQGARVFNEATKYVASRGRPRLEWSNSVLLEGDAAEAIAALEQEDGPELQVHGSANLIQTLLRRKLVDQYRLWVFPVRRRARPVARGSSSPTTHASPWRWRAAPPSSSSPMGPRPPSSRPSSRGRPGCAAGRRPAQRRLAVTIQARESNQIPSPLACAASVSRSRSSARSAAMGSSRFSTSFVHVKPRTQSSAAATSGP
jgi:dihydrofolate reductase